MAETVKLSSVTRAVNEEDDKIDVNRAGELSIRESSSSGCAPAL